MSLSIGCFLRHSHRQLFWPYLRLQLADWWGQVAQAAPERSLGPFHQVRLIERLPVDMFMGQLPATNINNGNEWDLNFPSRRGNTGQHPIDSAIISVIFDEGCLVWVNETIISSTILLMPIVREIRASLVSGGFE